MFRRSMRLQIQKQHIPDRIIVINNSDKIIFCATSSSPSNSSGRVFLLSQSSKRQKNPKNQIMPVENFNKRSSRKKRTPGLVSPSSSTMGMSLFTLVTVFPALHRQSCCSSLKEKPTFNADWCYFLHKTKCIWFYFASKFHLSTN